jgi:hypothetical protein
MVHIDGGDAGNYNQMHVSINAEITRIEAEIATAKAYLVFLEQQEAAETQSRNHVPEHSKTVKEINYFTATCENQELTKVFNVEEMDKLASAIAELHVGV